MSYKNLSIIIIIVFISFNLFSQNDKNLNPKEIKEKSNFHISLLCDNNSKFIHLYFVDSKVSIKNVKEEIYTLNREGEVVKGYTNLKYLDKIEGKVYLLNNNGELLFDKAFENLLLPQYIFKNKMELDPVSQNVIFSGYVRLPSSSFNSLKSSNESKFYLNSITSLSDTPNNLIIGKVDSKWGAINFKGETVVDFKYSEYKKGENGLISFYDENNTEIKLLNKIDFTNNPKPYIIYNKDFEIASFDLYIAHKDKGVILTERIKGSTIPQEIKDKILKAPQALLINISSIRVNYNNEIKTAGSKTYYFY